MAKANTIVDLKEEVSKLTAEKRVIDGELTELWPLRKHMIKLDRLRKELEERDFELSWEESKKKGSDLKLALKKLKNSDSTLQSALQHKEAVLEKWRGKSSIQCARDEEKSARGMVDSLLSDMEKERIVSECKMDQF